jgi:hypothetical protein
MEINRNQYFFAGLVLLLLGLQYQIVDSLVLNPQCTKLLTKEEQSPIAAASNTLGGLMPASTRSVSSKVLRPPDWLSWAMLSVGAVLVLHSWAMPKPG